MRERRLIFGEVADSYDRYRPSYPARLVDDVITLAGLDGDRAVLEVGAGTGKATALFAARGIPVIAIEPNADMAGVATDRLRAYPTVSLEQSDFEQWDPRDRRFPLLFCAQAWHWITPASGYPRARAALDPHGLLAVFRNNVAWAESDMREPLLAAYRAAPGLDTDGPMHPANVSPAAEQWPAEIAAVDGFGEAEVRFYDWELEYSVAGYLGLLGTLSEIHLLDSRVRARLLAAVSAAIQAHGGRFTLPLRTRLCLARRSESAG